MRLATVALMLLISSASLAHGQTQQEAFNATRKILGTVVGGSYDVRELKYGQRPNLRMELVPVVCGLVTAQLRDAPNRASAWFVHLLKTNQIYITNVRLQNRPGQSQSEAEMQFNNYCIGWNG